MKKKLCISVFLFLWILVGFTQELPPTNSFSPQQYGAGNQNWAISQANNKTIYVANNLGLLEYNGARWNLYKSPNNTILRSVKVIGDRIYTGCYMDFGYWKENQYGALDYTSLLDKLKEGLVEDEEIWTIAELEGKVIFQSLDRIFIYDLTTESFRIIDPKTQIIKMYVVEGDIYFQKINGSICKLLKGEVHTVLSAGELQKDEVVNVFASSYGLLIETRENGFYILSDFKLTKWNISANDLLQNSSVYNSIKLKDGTYLLGTISKGIIQLNTEGDIILKMEQSDGLNNNTILSLFEDVSGNIWLGLDNGINVLNFNSPFKSYKDSQGVLGTIYASARINGYTYLGTNQGLFYREEDPDSDYKFIPKTKGQVWSLDVVNGTLFCGHDKGTFVVRGSEVTQISNEKGTWKVEALPGNNSLLIQGNYEGLHILKNENGAWVMRNKLEGFDISSRYFEFINSDELLVSHEYKGVYQLKLGEGLGNVESYKKLNREKGSNSSIISYNNDIFYAYNEGVFKYNEVDGSFQRDSILSSFILESNYTSGKLINDTNANRLWGFTQDQLIYVEPENLTGNYKINKISLSDQVRKSKTGYENILYLDTDTYLLGSTEGYMVLDLDKINTQSYTIVINSVGFNPIYGEGRELSLENEETQLKNKENTVRFRYSLADYSAYLPSEYQYRLIGIYNDWSNWSKRSEVLFENLPHGDFTFEVRARVGEYVTANTATYSFNIKRPWYLTHVAILGYCLLFVVIILSIQMITRWYYKKQKERALARKEREIEYKELENQKQVVEFRNTNLQQDIENKNRELGISTMNLIKKNEFLSGIKNELKDVKAVRDVKSVIRTIDRNINNKDDWKFFEKAFNNADKDFLKKVKSIHPELTPNDLKLCAYLRLNLASKEIAPLLNISPRSVEVKRYRLRKKMNLPHEASLTNYIIDI